MSPLRASRPPTRVLVVARHFAMRRGLIHLLCTCADFQVNSEAHDEATALAAAARQPLDVMVLDWPLRDDSDGDFVMQLCQRAPSARILLLATFADDVLQDPVVRAAADCILLKCRADECLVDAIRALNGGEQ